uniref:ATP synthase subunit a n=1 Tax=Prionospio sp. 6 MH-2023 TaxID=3059274 RepID=A0AAU6QGF9_9ANNE
MMMDIFSSFDPATTSIFNFSPLMFWSMNIMMILLIHPLFWASPNQLFWLLSFPINTMDEQSNRTTTSHLKGLTTILVALFILIIGVNFMGIAPYVFSASSHLFFTLVLGLPLWLSLILSSLNFSASATLASLLPGGAPAWLNPFLVLIEMTSTIVRPITLSFRLAANMSAGHIVLTLISVYLVYAALSNSVSAFLLLFFIQAGYTIFEMGICLIQAYIFCLLLTL